MVSLNRIGFELLNGQTINYVSLNVTGFKFLSRQGFCALCQWDLDLNPTDRKKRGHLWIMAILDTKFN